MNEDRGWSRRKTMMWLGIVVPVVAAVAVGSTLLVTSSGSHSNSAPPTTTVHQAASVNTTPVTSGPVEGPMPLPSGSPPSPALATLLPPNEHVLTESWVRLDGKTPQVVVTDSDQSASSPNGYSTDLVLFGWDSFAKRWVNIFDAAKTPAPGNDGTNETILPASAMVSDLTYATITPTPGRTDLAFWAGISSGTNAPFDEYIVHYDGQTVSVVYSGSGEGGTAKVVGVAPRQQLSMTAEWVDPVDPECCAVRNFTQTVGWNSSRVPGATIPTGYQVLVDTRSWMGVYVATRTGFTSSADSSATPPPVVMSVVPGSPAAGVLQPGDQLLSVSGIPAPTNPSSIGPPVIDQIDSQQPGTLVVLSIERGGQQLTENIKLSSYANPAEAQASAPTPGYLGVQVAESSPSSTPGAYIAGVESGGPASQAGLEYGDVITSFGTNRITTSQQLQTVLLASPSGTTSQLVYVDNSGTPHAVTVTLSTYPSPGSSNNATVQAPFVYKI